MRQLLEDGAKAMGISLSQRQLDQFETYHRLLVEWNEKMNLTAITEKEEVYCKHFLDSLEITLVSVFFPHSINCSIAPALKVSPATNITFLPSCFNLLAILPI